MIKMINKIVGLLLVLPLVGAPPVGYKYWSAAELKAMSKPLSTKAENKTSSESLGKFGPDHALMIHREASGVAELHESEADVIMVVSGEGTLVVGGAMPGSKTTAPGEVRAPSVQGGERQKIAPGDILHIAPKTPHQVLLEPGTQITYFTLKVKE
jgi:mannose-6-phosphate isomerase-like protein (cupin superfamily)